MDFEYLAAELLDDIANTYFDKEYERLTTSEKVFVIECIPDVMASQE